MGFGVHKRLARLISRDISEISVLRLQSLLSVIHYPTCWLEFEPARSPTVVGVSNKVDVANWARTVITDRQGHRLTFYAFDIKAHKPRLRRFTVPLIHR